MRTNYPISEILAVRIAAPCTWGTEGRGEISAEAGPARVNLDHEPNYLGTLDTAGLVLDMGLEYPDEQDLSK